MSLTAVRYDLDASERESASPRIRRRRGGRVHPAWIVVACSAAVLVRVSMHTGLNTDVFWQLAAGKWMLAHHAVITSDRFSYTVAGRHWFAEEWGFEVLLAELVRRIGPATYWLLSGGCCAAALVASAARWRRDGADPTWVAVLAVPTTAALLIGLAPRPQDLSYLFFALELVFLREARRNRGWLAALPLLLLLWANVHGSFLLGLAVLALAAVLSGAPPSRTRRARDERESPDLVAPLARHDALAALVASVTATLGNPHGPRLLTYAVRVATASPLGAIEEWQSPNFHDALILAGIAVPTVLLVICLATHRRDTRLFDVLLWSGCLLATLHAMRFAPYLGIAAAGLAAPWNLWPGAGLSRHRASVPLALALGASLLVGPHVPAGAPAPSAAPVVAVRWLSGRPGRIFSTYEWNDYLVSRGIPVFVDGRTDLYFGTSVLSTYEAVAALDRRPDAVLSRWRVRWVLWPAHQPLSVYLASDRQWRLARRFAGTDLYERRESSD